MAGFPSLEPAFTAQLHPAEEFKIGNTSSGSMLSVVPISSGTIVSEPGFAVPLDAEFAFGSDYVRVEASQTHVRINVKAILKNKDGALLSYSYKGIIKIDAEFMAIFMGSPGANTTAYGNSVTYVTFETGAEHLRELEHSLFVGSAHFVVEGGKYFIETKVSRVRG